MNTPFDWLVVTIALTGTIANVYQKRWGFYCWLVANSVLLVQALRAENYAMSVLWATYSLLAVWGLLVWGKKGQAAGSEQPSQ